MSTAPNINFFVLEEDEKEEERETALKDFIKSREATKFGNLVNKAVYTRIGKSNPN